MQERSLARAELPGAAVIPTVRLLGVAGGDEVRGVADGLAAARAGAGLLWVELDHPRTDDFADLTDLLDLHVLAVEDSVDPRDRPKLDIYDSQRFLALVTLQLSDKEHLVGRVMLFVGDAFVVAVRQEDGTTLERVRRQIEHSGAKPPAPLDVALALVDAVVEDLGRVSDEVEAALLACADRLFEARSDEAHELYRITRRLLALAHAVQPLIEPLRHLSAGSVPGISLEDARRFQDVLDHAIVLDREISDHSDLVEHLRGANDSRIGLQQNTDMRKIAAWAAVIAVPTAVSGFYGMNVPYPGSGETGGFLSAVGLQGVLAVLLFVLFRRRRWL